MNEERTGKCLRQVEHIRGQAIYNVGITVTQEWDYGRKIRFPYENGNIMFVTEKLLIATLLIRR
jgi:hypothetical protein